MTKHVTHLLAPYVEDQLGRRRARRVRQHVAACPACYEELARHERLAADLRLTLGQSTHAVQPQRPAAWLTGSARPTPARNYLLPTALIPIVLSLALLIIPLLSGGANPTVSSAAPRLDATLLSTEAIAMQAPSTTEDGLARPAQTTIAFEDTSWIESTPPPPDAILAEPVPRPPSTSERIR
jgi:anti-sigma factor RsiW